MLIPREYPGSPEEATDPKNTRTLYQSYVMAGLPCALQPSTTLSCLMADVDVGPCTITGGSERKYTE